MNSKASVAADLMRLALRVEVNKCEEYTKLSIYVRSYEECFLQCKTLLLQELSSAGQNLN
jgi:hypothetical protein